MINHPNRSKAAMSAEEIRTAGFGIFETVRFWTGRPGDKKIMSHPWSIMRFGPQAGFVLGHYATYREAVTDLHRKLTDPDDPLEKGTPLLDPDL